MAKSLAKLKEQIAKLQKEADSIQSTVISRIKREIAQHGLTAAHLFESGDTIADDKPAKAASSAPKAKPVKKAGVVKPAKFADHNGNSWHGIGKRPQWIRDALDAGQSLDEFLVGARKPSAGKPLRAALKAAPKATEQTVAKGKVAPTKKAAKTTKAPVATKPAAKATAKKPAQVAPVKRAPSKKTVKAEPVKKPRGKKPAKVAAAVQPAAAATA